jgi:cellulose synthase/poly-beta-1,6-N-acetylglucosamine synthase-like glycosyltransferase
VFPISSLQALLLVFCVSSGFLLAGFIVLGILIGVYGKPPKFHSVHLNGDLPTCTIVIPCRNERGIIRNRLENLLRLEYPRERLEVLFVDASTDGTTEVIKDYSRKYSFIHLEKQVGLGFNAALNQGYSAAKGDIVVKSDCDAMPESKALLKLVAHFSDPFVGGVTGIHKIEPETNKIERIFRELEYHVQYFEARFHSTLIAHGAFFGFRRKLVPVLPEYVTGDDSVVVISIVRSGYRCIIDSEIQSVEKYPEKFGQRRSIRGRHAAGLVKVLFENIDMLFNSRYGWFGFISLPIYFFLAVLFPIMILISLFALGLYLVMSTPLYVMLLPPIFIFLEISRRARWRYWNYVLVLADVTLSFLSGLIGALLKRRTWTSVRES